MLVAIGSTDPKYEPVHINNPAIEETGQLKLSDSYKPLPKVRLAVADYHQSTAAPPSGGRTDWLIAVGIPKADWYFVDCIINGCEGVGPEGGWDGVQRWNTAGSGAYGLCQALPAEKMASAGPDWRTNPITQLKWCHDYAQGYGGWAQAWQFRKCVGSCYSPRTGTVVTKDHTWW